MGDPYTDVSVSGYNSNPPPDDGSSTAANEITWATIKTKLPDPLNTAIQSMNTNIGAAVDKLAGGITSTATNYTVLAADQGKSIVCTAGSITITTPAAATVGSPFKFKVVNNSSGTVTLDGNASETIDGNATIAIPAGAGADIDTDGTNWFTGGQNYVASPNPPQGYLSLVSATPVIVSDQSAKTAVYYTLDKGNNVPIPNGTTFKSFSIAELTLTLVSSHVASALYDVFLFENPSSAGTIVIGTGPAWTTGTAGSGARGSGAGTTELTRLLGLYVNNVSMTARNGSTTYSVGASSALYVGTILMDGTNGQISCTVSYGQSRKWGVWNAYNRKPITMKVGDSTASWTYGTATVRQARADSTNTAAVMTGLQEERIYAQIGQAIVGGTGSSPSVGIGVDSTAAYSGAALESTSNAVRAHSVGWHVNLPILGLSNFNALETGDTGTSTHYGTEKNHHMTITYNG